MKVKFGHVESDSDTYVISHRLEDFAVVDVSGSGYAVARHVYHGRALGVAAQLLNLGVTWRSGTGNDGRVLQDQQLIGSQACDILPGAVH